MMQLCYMNGFSWQCCTVLFYSVYSILSTIILFAPCQWLLVFSLTLSPLEKTVSASFKGTFNFLSSLNASKDVKTALCCPRRFSLVLNVCAHYVSFKLYWHVCIGGLRLASQWRLSILIQGRWGRKPRWTFTTIQTVSWKWNHTTKERVDGDTLERHCSCRVSNKPSHPQCCSVDCHPIVISIKSPVHYCKTSWRKTLWPVQLTLPKPF